ncbi:hypothetical protein H0H92_008695 [Tricholoma furcatifolium]|nr:hypothetical protein H0H92_008695 [Tricholoma furcatifolium]
MSCASSSKTPYTPVFYATNSQDPGPTKPIPKGYLERMSKQHIALATKVQEAPSSRSPSPESEERSAARIDALRREVEAAFKHANGDPADGKWSTIAQLLKLNATRSKRWLRTSTEGILAESGSGWINAETEEEWEEWEAKWKEEDRVKKKVENWKRNVEVAPAESSSILSISQQEKSIQRAPTVLDVVGKGKRAASSTLGTLAFPVVKRSSLNVTKKPSVTSVKASVNNSSPGPSRLGLTPLPHAAEPSHEPVAPKPSIQDVSESSFLPPSFDSQVETSTPNQKTLGRHKPEPIVLVPPSPSPLSNVPSLRVYGRQRTIAADTPADLPTTPMRAPQLDAQREKRAHSVSPPHAVKKPRVQANSPEPTSESPRPLTPPPVQVQEVTPKRAPLPKLTDLLASAKKNKVSESKLKMKTATKSRGSASVSLEVTPVTTPAPRLAVEVSEKSAMPQQEEEEEEEEEEENHKEEGEEGRHPSHDAEEASPLEPEEGMDSLPLIFDGQPTGMYDYVTRLTNDEDENDRERSSAYKLVASPARSLSSLAASESESEADNEGQGPGFNPPFTSTQVGGKEKTLGWMGYNSQFDVDGKVDMVSKFMEKDADVDFAGWLRDPSVERGDVDFGESQ